MATESRNSFLRNLLTRRVPQFLGGYFAAGWIIIEFIDWLVNRYPISPYLVEFCLVALASLLPTVILIAYFHGKPGRDSWTRVEKIGIPTNLLITAALLFFLFQGRELGATTTTVTVVDENGEQIERSVPKIEFRKNIALFPFENVSGNSENDWLGQALPVMTQFDMFQDMFINVISTYELVPSIKDAGFQADDQVPLTLKKKIAGEHYMDYFLTGVIKEMDGKILVEVSLYDQKTAKLIAENSFSGDEFLGLVDEISIQIKDDLKVPLQHIETTVDMPVREIMTASIPALKYFFSGISAIAIDDDWLGGIELLEKSVQEDETFAYGYVHLYTYSMYSNQGHKAAEAFEPLMQHLYKLPERTQFGVKHDYYSMIKQDRPMALEVAKNWAELYPDDLKAHAVLAVLYRVRNQLDDAIAELKMILSLNPKQSDLLLKIGDLYKIQGDVNSAQTYYQQYLEEFPNGLKAYMEIGDLKMLTGAYEEAQSYYNKARLIEPDDLTTLLSLAKIDSELGNFNESLLKYNEALESCKTPEDHFEVYTSLENYHHQLGQIHKSMEYMELKFIEYEKYAPPLMIIDQKSESLGKYIRAGDSETAYKVLKETEAQMVAPPMDMLVPLLYLDYYLEMKEIEKAQEALVEVEEVVKVLQLEILRAELFDNQGTIYELNEEYKLAIESYSNELELDPTNTDIHVKIGRCYRKIKEYKKAEESIKTSLLIHPFHPKTNYEMALVYAESANSDEALKHLRIAQEIWEESDPDYKPAIWVREKIAELEASIN